MKQYINKDAVMAEIERRIKFFTEESGNSNSDIVIALFGLKSFLDTLEVKEVQEWLVSEELMEAANNYCVVVRKGYPRVMDKTDRYIYNAFKAGAQWQKEQMMKDAFDAEYFDGSVFRNDLREIYKDGDNVKVIIIKEE